MVIPYFSVMRRKRHLAQLVVVGDGESLDWNIIILPIQTRGIQTQRNVYKELIGLEVID